MGYPVGYPVGYPIWDNTGPGLERVFQVLDTISFKRYGFRFSVGYPMCQDSYGISRGIIPLRDILYLLRWVFNEISHIKNIT